jgi:hypothetical protein
MLERAAYSPQEFSSLFGRSQTWGYRQIYAGRVETITQFGRIMIPASEVTKIVQTAEKYSGQKPKSVRAAKKDFTIREPKSVWKNYLASRRAGEAVGQTAPTQKTSKTQVLRRIFAKASGSQAAQRRPAKRQSR